MPTPTEILAGLTQISNEGISIAIAWHVLVCGFVVLSLVRRPHARLAAIVTALPLASASAFAWAGHNPFNGTVLALGTLALVIIGARLGDEPIDLGPRWGVGVGIAMLAFGLLYPHFLVGHPLWHYALASPVGLVPCPSLAVVLGLGLCADGFGSRAWTITAGALGMLYGLFGALRLGVWLDVGLVLGAAAALVLARRTPARASDRRAPSPRP